MGRVIFLNEQSRKFHEDQGIKVYNPDIKLVVDNGPIVRQVKQKKAKSAKKSSRKTLGQRIYENMLENGHDPKNPA